MFGFGIWNAHLMDKYKFHTACLYLMHVLVDVFTRVVCVFEAWRWPLTRWLVGSSSNRRDGFKNRARANDTRMRQPPEKSFVFLDCISLVNPRPNKILPERRQPNDPNGYRITQPHDRHRMWRGNGKENEGWWGCAVTCSSGSRGSVQLI